MKLNCQKKKKKPKQNTLANESETLVAEDSFE
jgi:hypothetical protein